MPPVFSKVEDSIERRLPCLKDLNDKKLELKNQRLRNARKRKHDGIDIVAPAPLTDEVIAIEILSSEDDVPNKKQLGLRGLQSGLILPSSTSVLQQFSNIQLT